MRWFVSFAELSCYTPAKPILLLGWGDRLYESVRCAPAATALDGCYDELYVVLCLGVTSVLTECRHVRQQRQRLIDAMMSSMCCCV